jgi:hypothetical protein
VIISKPFYLATTETTQEQYQAVMGNNPSAFSAAGSFKGMADAPNTAKFPVDKVLWDDAAAFCGKIKAQLPTEAQWEYACRAGTTTEFHFGDSLNGSQANCDGTKPHGSATVGPNLQRTTTVASYAPNSFGLYDMHGNVREWCRDWWDPQIADLPEIDPERTVKAASDGHVFRGGSWHIAASQCAAWRRQSYEKPIPLHYTGFRIIVPVSGQAGPPDKKDRMPENKADAAPSDRERRAAQLLLPHCQLDIKIVSNGRNAFIQQPDAILPDEPFEITKIFPRNTANPAEVHKVFWQVAMDCRHLRVVWDLYGKLALTEDELRKLTEMPFAGSLEDLRSPAQGFELTPATLDALKRFPKLASFSCRAIQADDAVLAQLKEMPVLKQLHLAEFGKSGRVTPRGYEAVISLPLTRLHLGSNDRLNREALRGFAATRSLTELVLFGKVEDDVLREVAKAPHVSYLNLSGNQALTDAGLVHLEGMKSLRNVVLEGTQVTQAGAKKLADALPKCRIDAPNGISVGPREK